MSIFSFFSPKKGPSLDATLGKGRIKQGLSWNTEHIGMANGSYDKVLVSSVEARYVDRSLLAESESSAVVSSSFGFSRGS